MSGVHLLAIDPQNDFCDLPESMLPPGPDGPLRPALAVPGAHADLSRLAAWLRDHRSGVDAITLTLDQHHRLDIAHPSFWRDAAGDPPPPFTPVSVEAVRSGVWRPSADLDPARALAYLEALESEGRAHTVWPVHCQIGTWGAAVHPVLQRALDEWEDARALPVSHVRKGENPWTEHYSALRAEVPVVGDPATDFDADLLGRLVRADRLLVAGEASSHCVKATVEHLLGRWEGDPGRIVLVVDAMSPVAGCEALQDDLFALAASRGVRLAPLATVLSA